MIYVPGMSLSPLSVFTRVILRTTQSVGGIMSFQIKTQSHE